MLVTVDDKQNGDPKYPSIYWAYNAMRFIYIQSLNS